MQEPASHRPLQEDSSASAVTVVGVQAATGSQTSPQPDSAIPHSYSVAASEDAVPHAAAVAIAAEGDAAAVGRIGRLAVVRLDAGIQPPGVQGWRLLQQARTRPAISIGGRKAGE